MALLASLLGCHGGSPDWPLPQDAPFRSVIAAGWARDPAPRAWLVAHGHERPPEQISIVGLRQVTASSVTTPAPLSSQGCSTGNPCARLFPTAPNPGFPVLAILRPISTPTSLHAPPIPVDLAARARWHLEELAWYVLGDQPTSTPTLSRPEDAQLRGLIKLRRELSPPLLVAVGEAGCLGLVSLMDHPAGKNLAWDTFPLPEPCAPLAAVPPLDLDGDGDLELLVYAGHGRDAPAFRGVYDLDPTRADEGTGKSRQHNRLPAALTRRWGEVVQPCPRITRRAAE